MTNESSDNGESWDERGSSDTFRTLTDAFYPGQYTSDTDSTFKSDALNAEINRESGSSLSTADIVELFRNVVNKARDSMQETLVGSEKIDETIQLNLTIDLNRKSIDSFPEEVVQILKRDVERIVLSHNQISHLPYKFSEVTNLTYLNLRGNRFREFPNALCSLQKLQILDLSRNQLVRLSDEIKNMRSLRVLSVMHNNLDELPLTLGPLESLRILKMAGNPWNEALRAIIAGSDSTPSPLVTPIGENEKDALLTIKIKQYLKAEADAHHSGGEYGNEGPLETPRPLKRNTSLRFPVVPAINSSESIADQRSPGFSKPPIPVRSHYRIASGQSTGPQTASFRRPNVSPLTTTSDRNRSNSESTFQGQAQNARSKRMGMMQKKAGGLDTLDEMRTSRNSFHLRGISHGSVLKDKQSNLRHAMGGGSSSSVSPVELDHGGIFVHRLSSVPEYKAESPPKDLVVEGAKGLLFSLHLVQSYFVTLLSLASDGESKRSSLERVYYNASTHFEQLNQEIGAYDGSSTQDPRHKKRLLRNIRRACRACAVSYSQVGNLLIQGSRHLLTKADQRYVRTLLLLVYGSTNEGVNAFMNLNIHTEMPKPLHVDKSAPPVIQREVPKLTVRSISPVKERPQPTRRYRSEANNTFRNTSHQKSSTNPQSAVPLHINGRSRSNSRSNIGGSAVSSVANTPRSGESFLIPNAQPLPIFEGGGLSNYQDPTHAALFEKIYLAFKSAVERGSAALPMVNSQFGRCLEASQSKYSNKNLTDLWQRLATRSRQCLDMCEALGLRLSIVKLNDPEVRNSQEFWSHITRYINSFVALVDEIKKATEANKAQLAPLDISRMLKPVHVCVKAATASLRESPWAYVLSHSSPPHSALTTQNQWQNHGHANGQTHGRLNGHHRTRGGSGSGSSSSPYLPTTPLSAALGPAAQATIPSSSTAFDRSFQGDVFQRAESFLNMQQTMLHRR